MNEWSDRDEFLAGLREKTNDLEDMSEEQLKKIANEDLNDKKSKDTDDSSDDMENDIDAKTPKKPIKEEDEPII